MWSNSDRETYHKNMFHSCVTNESKWKSSKWFNLNGGTWLANKAKSEYTVASSGFYDYEYLTVTKEMTWSKSLNNTY